MKGVSIDTAHDLVRQCIDADNDMECLRPFLVRHEDPAQDVIQVDGIRVAGVPLGSPEFVTRYVQYVTAEWEPAFLRQAREFPFFPFLPREASK